tara:strand:+ start:36288 stop:36869 length:582 start_codon:yes stop_codon:yes gene_type:complete
MSIAYVNVKKREDFPEHEEMFNFIESYMGYLPYSYLLMAENPVLLNAFSGLTNAVFGSNEIDNQTKQLIALASSLSSGCKYCQSHTSHGAKRTGVSVEKISEILDYENSIHFSEKEKSVLSLAFASGKVPNQANKTHFDTLKEFFNPAQITMIVSVISIFGFLNRWNDTFGTTIEKIPRDFVEKELIPLGWKK